MPPPHPCSLLALVAGLTLQPACKREPKVPATARVQLLIERLDRPNVGAKPVNSFLTDRATGRSPTADALSWLFTGSTRSGGNVVSWEWDWTAPIDFGAPDANTETVDATAAFAAKGVGQHDVGLRVTDDDNPATTNSEFTTVTIVPADDPGCNTTATVFDSIAPEISCDPDLTVECDGFDGTVVLLEPDCRGAMRPRHLLSSRSAGRAGS